MPAHKKPIASIMVPIRGNYQTRKAINKLAKLEGKFVADITFEAIRIVYGKRFEGLLDFYRVPYVNQNDQSEPENSA